MTQHTPVLNFVPRAELDAAGNLRAFIALCRESDVLDARAQFEQTSWDIGHLKGHNKLHRAIFSTLESSKPRSKSEAQVGLPKPFVDFAKATIVYMHDMRPVESQAPRVAALRCLEATLRQLNKGSRPTAVDPTVLDTAVELAYAQTTVAVAYRTAGQIEAIAKLMNDKGFIGLRQTWNHGRKKPDETSSRISPEALKARQEKLPSRATLEALADIYCRAVKVPDVLVSSNTALMLCAPERINEVLRLRRNCFVEGDGEFKGKLGVRWSGSKGFENTTKWIPTAMGPVAREAIENLLRVSAPANELARWYSENPSALYLHEGAEHLRKETELSLENIALILWDDVTAIRSAWAWATETHELTRSSPGRYFFADVERAVLSMLPATFPFMPGDPDLRCKDAVAVLRVNEMNSTKRPFLCMFTTVDYQSITKCFSTRKGKQPSIFERFGWTEADGTPISLKSHALRHYLNMLAQTGGLSSAEIALFSGRKDQTQNRAYDHMSSVEVQAPVAEALKAGFTSELEPVNGERRLISRDEFVGLGIRTGHTTKYGWCEHDFASEPCSMSRDCVNCQEHECVKGDSHKEANLRTLKTQTEYFLRNAQKALTAEEFGADTWVAHHTKTLERVNALLAIFEDPNISAGAKVRLDVHNAPLITQDNVRPIQFVRRSRHKALA
ncbi:integrase [Paracidovorax konjaci]|uniref:Uncharacterized protein n=1 Tax=Paracidovorax konjaci TaxID=32040 RepID=A0A1I1XJ50_9BURK|nr:integrase [Paracidovorax konjaci]SFE07387.1 hypothetical protein SAMN04489710_113101 [Paracidovorax konjaci]